MTAIHRVLRMQKYRRGATARELATETGLAIGAIEAILKKSECVLKRRSHNHSLWWADWADLEDNFRQRFKRGRRLGYSPKRKPLSTLPVAPGAAP